MSLHHSEETHQQLVARIPGATGRNLPEWFRELEEGPGLMRFEERVNWLRDEHGRPLVKMFRDHIRGIQVECFVPTAPLDPEIAGVVT